MCRLVCILIFLWLLWKHGHAFEVLFGESYPAYRIGSDLDTESQRLHKRDMQQFFDKGVFLNKIKTIEFYLQYFNFNFKPLESVRLNQTTRISCNLCHDPREI